MSAAPHRTLLLLGSIALLAALAAVVRLRSSEDPAPVDRGQDPAPTIAPRELVSVDPTYHELAAATGGALYLWSPGEFARADLEIPPGGEAVHLSYGALPAPEGGTRSFTFPVDGVTGRIDVFVSAQRLDEARVRRPSGAELADGEPGVRLRRHDRMLLLAVDTPESGEWSVTFRGAGLFAATVEASRGHGLPYADASLEPIECLGAELVERRGRPGHEGWFLLLGLPAAGERHRARLTLSGSLETASFHLADLAGEALDTGPVAELERDGEEFLLEITVPDRPFRFVAQGEDVTGAPYRRFFAGALQPESGPGGADRVDRDRRR